MFEKADLIHRYSRADALRGGVLIDVSATAREAGIRWPAVLTQAAWACGLAGSPYLLIHRPLPGIPRAQTSLLAGGELSAKSGRTAPPGRLG
jgi:hypothetical protein